MCRVLFFIFFVFVFFANAAKINLRTHGPIEYCNVNPYQWNFQPLSESDIIRIEKLVQLHVLARHGTRILPQPITDTFPNSNASWNCNFTTVITRHYKNEAQWMSFKLHYVKNEEIVEGSCASSSSLAPVISQHSINAKMVNDFYIGDEPRHLMTDKQLKAVAAQLTYVNMLGLNDNIKTLKVLAANYERTITSATIFLSEFLDIHEPTVTMELYTHDIKSDPYTPQNNKICKNLLKYVDDTSMTSKRYQFLVKSDEMEETVRAWYNETGQQWSISAAQSAILMYCGNLDVPISWDTFMRSLNMSYKYHEALYANSETSFKTCSLASSPMSWLLHQMINNRVTYLEKEEIWKAEKGFEEVIDVNVHKRKEQKRAIADNNGNDFETGLTTDMDMEMDLDEVLIAAETPSNFHFASETEADYDAETNYLKAKETKFVYHSVHDYGILFLLEACNISNGREPMFAEVLTLEIYSRSLDDPYYKRNIDVKVNELYENYLFRWTRKGMPLVPFPGCEQEYEDTHSDLCGLTNLMDILKHGVNIKQWEPICKSIVDDYFESKKEHKKQAAKKNENSTLSASSLYAINYGVDSVLDPGQNHNADGGRVSPPISVDQNIQNFLLLLCGIAIGVLFTVFGQWFKRKQYLNQEYEQII